MTVSIGGKAVSSLIEITRSCVVRLRKAWVILLPLQRIYGS